MEKNKYELKSLYKSSCFEPDPKGFLLNIKNTVRKMQVQADVDYLLNNAILSNVCKHCNKEISVDDFDYGASYWTPNLWRPYHKQCKREALNNEALECQKIDQNCNDCKWFKRGELTQVLTKEHAFLKTSVLVQREEERQWKDGDREVVKSLPLSRIAVEGDLVKFSGVCEKRGLGTIALSSTFLGYECFEHRKQ